MASPDGAVDCRRRSGRFVFCRRQGLRIPREGGGGAHAEHQRVLHVLLRAYWTAPRPRGHRTNRVDSAIEAGPKTRADPHSHRFLRGRCVLLAHGGSALAHHLSADLLGALIMKTLVQTKASLAWLVLVALTVTQWVIGTQTGVGSPHHVSGGVWCFRGARVYA